MSKELIVSAGRHETRVAVIEDDQLVEIFHEREKEYSLAGSIHKGRVTRVLPGMQSAFVDIGLDRDAFLYVSDFFEDGEEYDAVVSTAENKVLGLEPAEGERTERVERPERPDGDRNRDRNRGRDRGGRGRDRDRRPRDGQQRDGQQRPAQAGSSAGPAPLVADGLPAEVTGEDNAVEVVETAAATSAELHPAQAGTPRPDRGDRGGDADKRGHRGRRRGRGGRLPDSKYASPRELSVPAPAARPSVHDSVEEEAGEDLPPLILPGESLAKYSRSDIADRNVLRVGAGAAAFGGPHGQRAPLSPEAADEAVAELREEIQEAISAAAPAAAPAAPVVVFAAPAAPAEVPALAVMSAPEVVPAPMPESGTHAFAARPVEPAAVVSAGPAPAVADQTADADDSGILPFLESGIDAAEEAGDAAGDEGPIAGDGMAGDEGPDVAGAPTSLTAQLREPGHRYPHRASRRMRRKLRQGEPNEPQSGEILEGGVAEAAPAGIDAVVVTESPEPAGKRPVQQRDDHRRDRDRGGRGRDNAERGEKTERPERPEQSERTERGERPDRERPPLPSISDLLKEGQEIIVQIAKEPIGQKGARITSHIALPGRFVVYMPTVEHVGVSRKIPSDEERQRLKKVLTTHRQGIPGGFICRTAADGQTEEELRSDMHFLYNLWLDLRQKAEKRPAPMLLHHDLDLVQRILRDQITASFKAIWVDSEELYESVLGFMQRHQPALVGRVKMYTRPAPIFDEFGITAELEKALRPKVWLKSGGYIVINQTEALVAIDINTGKYVGKSNRLEDTIVKVNTDATKEIVRQIRLRDLGGIIVVDFIDMEERRNRAKVMQALEEAMRADRAPNKILQFNDFGLVAITRKRVKQSLERTLCTPCPYCEGAGHVKAVQTVVGEILTEAQRMQKALADANNNVVLRVNPEVAKVLKSNRNTFLQEIEEIVGKSVMVKSDPLLHQTKFDLA